VSASPQGGGGQEATGALVALGPAKVNLGLFLGAARAADDRHELVSVMQSISLADELALQTVPAGAAADEVLCPGVDVREGENLAAAALRAFRQATGWQAPPQRLSILKRIPVAGGLAGGSADAAAALRLAACAAALDDPELLHELAVALGADVPAQLAPGRWLATAAGERLQRLPDPGPALGVLVLPLAGELSTAAVYAEADRLALARDAQALEQRRRALQAALALGAPLPAERTLLHNDLQAAALSLCPAIGSALTEAREAGAEHALVSGSGPTVVGLFARANAGARAQRAAASLAGRTPAPAWAVSVQAGFAAPRRVGADSGDSGLGSHGRRART
jgi:4-diphosphocytidyl-2-C-methyl-D-erythritol kinase